MKISGKVLVSVSTIVAIYTVISFAVLKIFIAPQFMHLEMNDAQKDLSRAQHALDREIHAVSSYGADYARWDDTYRYITSPNKAYIDSNYNYAAMKAQNIDLVCITDRNGRIIFSQTFSHTGESLTPKDYSDRASPLLHLIAIGKENPDTVYNGIIETTDGLMLTTSYPIIDSQLKMPPDGRLIAGRLFDESEQTKIKEILRTDISIEPVTHDSVNSQKLLRGIAVGNGTLISKEEKVIRLFTARSDIFGQPVAILTLRHEPKISQKGFEIVNLSVLILAGCGIIVLISILLYLHKEVVDPLQRLEQRTKEIAATDDFLIRLPDAGGDEISILAQSFNHLLDRLSAINTTLELRVEERTAELAESNRGLILLGSVFESSLEGIFITDRNGILTNVNPSYTRITGFSAEEVIGSEALATKSERHDEKFYREMKQSVAQSGKWSGEIWSKNKRGRVYPQWTSISSITDENGDITHLIGVFHDISDAKQQESYIKYQAYHDTLTGLPNRVLLLERMGRTVERSTANNIRFAILFLDLDHFKNINDSMGHEYGDILLQHVAERLEKLTRVSDTISRLGGDEFIVMIEDITDDNQPGMLSDRIIDSFKNPFIVKNQIFHVGTSVGIAIFPDDGNEPSVLMRNADTAMYQAKEQGRLRYCYFTRSLNERLAVRIRMENELRMAIETNEFEVHYQPKMNIKTGAVNGFEALVRWNNNGKLIAPIEFIPLAEETGLILSLDRIVMQQTFKDIQLMNASREKPYVVALNASAKALQQKRFPEEVADMLESTGMKPEWVEIEITETDVMKDIDACLNVIRRLSEMGISIALDDFGTGYSSLSQLSRIPVNTLKIDRSFVITIDNGKNETSIIDNIYAMAKDLHLKVVAEGVETDAQLEYLTKIGCDLIQGYYFSKPLPLKKLNEFLSDAEAAG